MQTRRAANVAAETWPSENKGICKTQASSRIWGVIEKFPLDFSSHVLYLIIWDAYVIFQAIWVSEWQWLVSACDHEPNARVLCGLLNPQNRLRTCHGVKNMRLSGKEMFKVTFYCACDLSCTYTFIMWNNNLLSRSLCCLGTMKIICHVQHFVFIWGIADRWTAEPLQFKALWVALLQTASCIWHEFTFGLSLMSLIL